jgi:hypothetical protein
MVAQGNPVSRPWWRYLRLRVSGTIVFVLGTGVILGWVVYPAHVQRDAVTAIERAGGRSSYDRDWPTGKPIANGRARWPRWLVNALGVDDFDSVVGVWIGGGTGSDSEMVQAGRLTHLEE